MWKRLWNTFRRAITKPKDQLTRDVDDEIAFHLEMREEQLRARGVPNARRAALVKFGNTAAVKEDVTRTWSAARGGFARDLRYGLRHLCLNPSYALGATAILALAIGAGTTMFSVLNAVLLRPLPFPDADRLTMIWVDRPVQGVFESRSAYENVDLWRQRARSFEDVAFGDPASAILTSGDDPSRIALARVSPNMFALLGARTLLGRTFTWEETAARAPVVVVSERFWQQHLGGTQNLAEARIAVDGRSASVIGVVSAEAPLFRSDVWEPFSLVSNWETARRARGTGLWFAVGKLRSGVEASQAEAEATALGRSLEPNASTSYVVRVKPVADYVTNSRTRLSLFLLGAAVLCVMLVAITNVMALALTRAVGREKEIGVRLALGATRRQVIRQLFAEGLLVAAFASVIGVGVAVASYRVVVAFVPAGLNGLAGISLDVRVLLFSVLASAITAVAVGLAPAVMAFRPEVQEAMRAEQRGMSGSRRTQRIRRLLVVGECALAVVLLVSAGLLVRSLQSVENAALGFLPERVVAMNLSTAAFTDEDRPALYRRILDRVTRDPGVLHAGIASEIMIGGDSDQTITLDGSPGRTIRTRFRADEATDGFFEAIGATIVRGRGFARTDDQSSERVVVIDESLERRLWPDGDGVGKRFKFGPETSAAPWFRVVGVVGNMRRQGLEATVVPQMFASLPQNPSRLVVLVVKTAGPTDGEATFDRLKAAARASDPSLPIYGVNTFENLLAGTVRLRRFQTTLVVAFATVALLLAGIGIFGLVHYGVVTRAKEIAIRRAVGAQAAGIYRLVMGEAVGLGLLGLAGGFVAAVLVNRLAAGFLVGVSGMDPVTFLGVAVVVLGCSALAGYFPARRANRIDPITSLR